MPGRQAAHDVPGHGDVAHAGGLPRARRLRRRSRRSLREMTARGRHQGSHGLGPAGPRRRGVPAGPQVGASSTSNDGQPHYLCANADEGEPGTFKDRWILENAPHLLLESMLIAAYALAGAQRLRLHPRRVRPAVPPARRRASRRRYAAGYFGEHILGSDVLLRHRRSTAAPGSYVVRRGVRACSPRSRASAAIRATGRRG